MTLVNKEGWAIFQPKSRCLWCFGRRRYSYGCFSLKTPARLSAWRMHPICQPGFRFCGKSKPTTYAINTKELDDMERMYGDKMNKTQNPPHHDESQHNGFWMYLVFSICWILSPWCFFNFQFRYWLLPLLNSYGCPDPNLSSVQEFFCLRITKGLPKQWQPILQVRLRSKIMLKIT